MMRACAGCTTMDPTHGNNTIAKRSPRQSSGCLKSKSLGTYVGVFVCSLSLLFRPVSPDTHHHRNMLGMHQPWRCSPHPLRLRGGLRNNEDDLVLEREVPRSEQKHKAGDDDDELGMPIIRNDLLEIDKYFEESKESDYGDLDLSPESLRFLKGEGRALFYFIFSFSACVSFVFSSL